MISRREMILGGLTVGVAHICSRADVAHGAAPPPRTKVNFASSCGRFASTVSSSSRRLLMERTTHA
jgi:hypothetical protein